MINDFNRENTLSKRNIQYTLDKILFFKNTVYKNGFASAYTGQVSQGEVSCKFGRALPSDSYRVSVLVDNFVFYPIESLRVNPVQTKKSRTSVPIVLNTKK